MCTGAEIGLLAASSAATAVAVDGSRDAKKNAKEAKAKSAQAEAERRNAESKATQDAYAKNAMARRALRQNSLFTGGGSGQGAGGRQTMGV